MDSLGVPSLVAAHSIGIQSVALISGDIKITLQDKYMRLMSVCVTEVGGSSLTAPVSVTAEDVATNKSVTLSNADAIASTTILVRIDVKNSSV